MFLPIQSPISPSCSHQPEDHLHSLISHLLVHLPQTPTLSSALCDPASGRPRGARPDAVATDVDAAMGARALVLLAAFDGALAVSSHFFFFSFLGLCRPGLWLPPSSMCSLPLGARVLTSGVRPGSRRGRSASRSTSSCAQHIRASFVDDIT